MGELYGLGIIPHKAIKKIKIKSKNLSSLSTLRPFRTVIRNGLTDLFLALEALKIFLCISGKLLRFSFGVLFHLCS